LCVCSVVDAVECTQAEAVNSQSTSEPRYTQQAHYNGMDGQSTSCEASIEKSVSGSLTFRRSDTLIKTHKIMQVCVQYLTSLSL